MNLSGGKSELFVDDCIGAFELSIAICEDVLRVEPGVLIRAVEATPHGFKSKRTCNSRGQVILKQKAAT